MSIKNEGLHFHLYSLFIIIILNQSGGPGASKMAQWESVLTR